MKKITAFRVTVTQRHDVDVTWYNERIGQTFECILIQERRRGWPPVCFITINGTGYSKLPQVNGLIHPDHCEVGDGYEIEYRDISGVRKEDIIDPNDLDKHL